MKISTITICLLLVLSGCQKQSKIQIPIPGDGVRVLEGKAADDYTAMIVANEKTAQGRTSDVVASMTKTIPFLMGVFVVGLCFWWATKSSWGWCVPAAAAAGIGLTFVFAQYGWWIIGIVFSLAVVLLAWKAVEYHRERDLNAKAGYSITNPHLRETVLQGPI